MKNKQTTKSQAITRKKPRLVMTELRESGEVEIWKEGMAKTPEKRVRFPRDKFKHFRQPTKKFQESRDAIKAYKRQESIDHAVYPNSIEVQIGHDSLFRVMREYLSDQIAYLRSDAGGMLSIEEARDRIYGKKANNEEFFQEMFDHVITKRIDAITYKDLARLARQEPNVAQNVWELIKRDAKNEFLTGNMAAESLDPLDQIKDAWNRAKFIGIRESFISQWKPQNSLEVNVIDTIAQTWFQLQHWMKVLSTRSLTEAKHEPYQYQKWKEQHRQANSQGWKEERWKWETPSISESEAIEQAAQMVDRFHRMYCRSLRLLQGLRKNSPQVTINNPQQVNMGEQVNIASDGGQQINVKADNNN